jgi:serine/threonine-protein kinase HipA
MRRANIFVNDNSAGILVENNDSTYSFTYNGGYNGLPVSLTLPITSKPYISKIVFPFFDGLIPEGWMLDIITKNYKINERDRMGLLLACCNDCIGNIRIERFE